MQTPSYICRETVRKFCHAFTGETHSEAFELFLRQAYDEIMAEIRVKEELGESPSTLIHETLSLSVPASGLLAFGHLDMVMPLLLSVGMTSQEAPEAAIYRLGFKTLKLLLPLPEDLKVGRGSPEALRVWFQEAHPRLVWNETEGRYAWVDAQDT